MKCTSFSASAGLLLAFDFAARMPSCESWNFASLSAPPFSSKLSPRCRVNRMFFAMAAADLFAGGGDGFVTGICRPLSAALAFATEGKHARCQASNTQGGSGLAPGVYRAGYGEKGSAFPHQNQALTTHFAVSCPVRGTCPHAVEIAQTSPSQRCESRAHFLNLRKPVLQPSLPVRATRMLGDEDGDQQQHLAG